jgi:RHS repeat-associated protein
MIDNTQHRRRGAWTSLAVIAAVVAPATIAQAQSLPAPPVSAAPVVNYEYDAQGNPTRTVLAPGSLDLQSRASYDSLDRVKDKTDARAGVTRFSHDGLDRTLQVTDPRGLVTQSPRTGLGDVRQLVSPDTGTASHTYDAAGNLKSRTDSRGVVTYFSYDAQNRMTRAMHTQGPSSMSVGWEWDKVGVPFGIGRIGQANHTNGNLRYAYDAQGKIVSATQVVNAVTGGNPAPVTLAASYGYTNGNLTGITYPSGRKLVVTYTGGVASSLGLAKDGSSAASLFAMGIKWQPFGEVRSWTWLFGPSTQAHERVFDTHGRIVRYRMGAVVRDLTYDAADRIGAYTHYNASTAAALPALDQRFAYDGVGRVTEVSTASANWTIGYDANGNRTSVTLNGVPSHYTTAATSNRIQGITNPARSFAYDNAGNTTADGNFSATYDLAGRMSRLTRAGITTTYTYDANGRRVRKFSSTGAASTVLFFYDEDGKLLGEYDGAGKAIQEYVWLGSTPVAVFTPDPAAATNPPLLYYIHTDHLDTPRVVVDRNNAIRWRWMAEPFGTTAAETNPSGLGHFTFGLRFPGQYFDQESGLHYNFFRDYDSSIGRYTTSDPIGLDGGINTYAYVSGDPLTGTDPLGLNRRGTSNLQITYSSQVSASQVSVLTNQIRQYDPSFNYQTIRPSSGPGSTYSRIDVNALTSILRAMQRNQTCSRDGVQVGQFIADQRGNVMIEPVGGSTGPYPPHRTNSPDTHTYYPNGSNYMRNNPQGHGSNTTPHGHGHLPGSGPGRSGQGSSLDIFGNVVPANSPAAHWTTY